MTGRECHHEFFASGLDTIAIVHRRRRLHQPRKLISDSDVVFLGIQRDESIMPAIADAVKLAFPTNQFCVTFLALIASSALGQDVNVRYDSDTGLSKFKTYKWVTLKNPAAPIDYLTDEQIKAGWVLHWP